MSWQCFRRRLHVILQSVPMGDTAGSLAPRHFCFLTDAERELVTGYAHMSHDE